MALNILSVCREKEGVIAIAQAFDDNAPDAKTGSARCPNCQEVSTLSSGEFPRVLYHFRRNENVRHR